jgi:hypothetical protein
MLLAVVHQGNRHSRHGFAVQNQPFPVGVRRDGAKVGATLDHAARHGIKAGPVQRMRHRPNAFAGGIARQPGVGVEGEKVVALMRTAA